MRRHTELGGVGRQTFKFNQAVFFFCLGIFQIEGVGWPLQCPKKGVFFGIFFTHSQESQNSMGFVNKIRPTIMCIFLMIVSNPPTNRGI